MFCDPFRIDHTNLYLYNTLFVLKFYDSQNRNYRTRTLLLQLCSDHRNDFIRVHKKDIFLAYNKLDTNENKKHGMNSALQHERCLCTLC